MATEPDPRLDGWKAIADYLGRDVRTAQRWRDERGMPVHRVPGGKGGTVFANSAELDAWLCQTIREPEAGPPAGIQIASHGLFGSITPLWVAALAIGLIAVTVAAFAFIRMQTADAAVPTRFELAGGTLFARSGDNAMLWSHRFADSGANSLTLSTTATIDFKGNGDPDIVMFVSVSQNADYSRGPVFLRHEIHCFASNGKLRWTYRPSTRLAFNGREFAGPWRLRAWLAIPGPKPQLWVSFIHHIWWPSFIVSVGGDGAANLHFVNSGHIETLAHLQLSGGSYVLAGGVNNEYRAAALAILDAEGEFTASPQIDGGPFLCDRCPNGRPRRYFLFPRSEISGLGEPYNFADEITVPTSASDGIEVSVRDGTGVGLNSRALYKFSGDLMPQSVAMSDSYWEMHRTLSMSGKLDHAPEDCLQRTRSVIVRMWEPDSGWKDIQVPPTFAPPAARSSADKN